MIHKSRFWIAYAFVLTFGVLNVITHNAVVSRGHKDEKTPILQYYDSAPFPDKKQSEICCVSVCSWSFVAAVNQCRAGAGVTSGEMRANQITQQVT